MRVLSIFSSSPKNVARLDYHAAQLLCFRRDLTSPRRIERFLAPDLWEICFLLLLKVFLLFVLFTRLEFPVILIKSARVPAFHLIGH